MYPVPPLVTLKITVPPAPATAWTIAPFPVEDVTATETGFL